MKKVPLHCSVLAAIAMATGAVAQTPLPPPMPAGPNPNSQYRLGPDSMPREGVPKGEIRGPFTLPSKVYPARSTLTGFTSRLNTIPPFPPA